ncbi:hypothetical protein DASB73_001100 [Starmerella bacillaris]|uniref:Autophagy-related protein 11 C-terminal domain-containing protein n=1 Tax=Starmerella bacillaris TaxID=1247836 RepID=A0AAV5RDG5_STABA|nr:hypothetical protein DASB73_001100 [Starmerella bacillaris]
MVEVVNAFTGISETLDLVNPTVQELKSVYSSQNDISPDSLLILSIPEGSNLKNRLSQRVCLFPLDILNSEHEKINSRALKASLSETEDQNLSQFVATNNGTLTSSEENKYPIDQEYPQLTLNPYDRPSDTKSLLENLGNWPLMMSNLGSGVNSIDNRIQRIQLAADLSLTHVQKHIESLHKKTAKRSHQFEELKSDWASCSVWPQFCKALASLPAPTNKMTELLNLNTIESAAHEVEDKCESISENLNFCTRQLNRIKLEMNTLIERHSNVQLPVTEPGNADLLLKSAQNELVNVVQHVKQLQQVLKSSLHISLDTIVKSLSQADSLKVKVAEVIDLPFLYGVLLIEMERRQYVFQRENIAQKKWIQRYFGHIKSQGGSENSDSKILREKTSSYDDLVMQRDTGVHRLIGRLAEIMNLRYLGEMDSKVTDNASMSPSYLNTVRYQEHAPQSPISQSSEDTHSNSSSKSMDSHFSAPTSATNSFLSPVELPLSKSNNKPQLDHSVYSDFKSGPNVSAVTYFEQLQQVGLSEIAKDLLNEFEAMKWQSKLRPHSPINQADSHFILAHSTNSVHQHESNKVKKLEELIVQMQSSMKSHKLDLVRAEARGEALAEAKCQQLIESQAARLKELEAVVANNNISTETLLNSVGLQTVDKKVVRMKGIRQLVNADSLSVSQKAVVDRCNQVENLAKSLRLECKQLASSVNELKLDVRNRIAVKDFKPGDLALFIPSRIDYHTKWIVFSQQPTDVFLHPKYYRSLKLKKQDYLVGRIENMELLTDNNYGPYKVVTLSM